VALEGPSNDFAEGGCIGDVKSLDIERVGKALDQIADLASSANRSDNALAAFEKLLAGFVAKPAADSGDKRCTLRHLLLFLSRVLLGRVDVCGHAAITSSIQRSP
jgi:hypothetical protein